MDKAVLDCSTGETRILPFSRAEEDQAVVDAQSSRDNVISDKRFERNRLLLESDWTQVLDVTLPVEKREAWVAYRQALRDFMARPDVATAPFPPKPETHSEIRT